MQRSKSFLKSVIEATFGSGKSERLRRFVNRIKYGGLSCYCVCCKSHLRRFLPYGVVPRGGALCPVCSSLERHRLIYKYIAEGSDLFDGQPKRILHVAPEGSIEALFRSAENIDYLSADLVAAGAMVKMDITDIKYPSEHFDAIYCSHVLEHVSDDRKAMREFYRVLRTGGWAILQVPITSEVTFEDATVIDPMEREMIFGQSDHVRKYGPDYVDRLREAGFSVDVDQYVRKMPLALVRRYGLMPSEDIYFCQKPERGR